jgi:hypothetical protein
MNRARFPILKHPPDLSYYKDAAVENIHNWRFHPPSCACRVKKEAVLAYSLSAELRSAPETPTVTVKWFLEAPVIRVDIEEAGGILIDTQHSH